MLFGFLLTVLYVPGIAGAATTPRWAVLGIVLPWFLFKPGRLTIVHVWGALFCLWAALSLTWTPNYWDGLCELLKLFLMTSHPH